MLVYYYLVNKNEILKLAHGVGSNSDVTRGSIPTNTAGLMKFTLYPYSFLSKPKYPSTVSAARELMLIGIAPHVQA